MLNRPTVGKSNSSTVRRSTHRLPTGLAGRRERVQSSADEAQASPVVTTPGGKRKPTAVSELEAEALKLPAVFGLGPPKRRKPVRRLGHRLGLIRRKPYIPVAPVRMVKAQAGANRDRAAATLNESMAMRGRGPLPSRRKPDREDGWFLRVSRSEGLDWFFAGNGVEAPCPRACSTECGGPVKRTDGADERHGMVRLRPGP